ncbi:MAG: hypothetical protein U0894_04150 [Pirellulales bacterium]
MKNRKVPTETELANWLKRGQVELPPLRFRLLRLQPRYKDRIGDFEVEAKWGDQRTRFAVEYKSLSTPKAFEQALWQCRALAETSGLLSLLVLPYLRPSQLDELELAGMSGIDLCGNGVVIVPGKVRVFRTGSSNQFATYAPIKNIYRKNTSMVPRVLLTRPQFSSVQEILEETNLRNVLARTTRQTLMSLGTVSKALKELENDLIVERSDGIRVLQPDKLLSQLEQNYEMAPEENRVRLKVDCEFRQLPKFLSQVTSKKNIPLVVTGLSSVSRYATMQREERLSVYCSDLQQAQQAIGGKETDRFSNLELIQSNEQSRYFDGKQDTSSSSDARFYWASPVQAYLELMRGDKRDRDTADQVRSYILQAIGKVT